MSSLSSRRATVSAEMKQSVTADVSLALNIILHLSDINNVFKKWEISRKWSDLVVEEFFNQVSSYVHFKESHRLRLFGILSHHFRNTCCV